MSPGESAVRMWNDEQLPQAQSRAADASRPIEETAGTRGADDLYPVPNSINPPTEDGSASR